MPGLKKYHVKMDFNLVVEARNNKAARKAINEIPWDEVVDFTYPKVGLIKEFQINASHQQKIISVNQRNRK